MAFVKFKIISGQNMQEPQEELATSILINTDHIVSLKPIKFVFGEAVVDGHWVRLSNGKKYRVLEVPKEFEF